MFSVTSTVLKYLEDKTLIWFSFMRTDLVVDTVKKKHATGLFRERPILGEFVPKEHKFPEIEFMSFD